MKKRFLKLLCMSAGLKNIKIETYRTDGCEGMYAISIGYKVSALDKGGKLVVNVETPEGFNDAVRETMQAIYETEGIKFEWVDTNEFKV